MVALSPVEGVPIGIAIILSLMVLGTLVGLIPALRQGLRQQQPWTQFCLCLLGGIIGGCVALVLGFTYGLGIDLTLAARYQFILYPAFLMVLAGILSPLGGPTRAILWFAGAGTRFSDSAPGFGFIRE